MPTLSRYDLESLYFALVCLKKKQTQTPQIWAYFAYYRISSYKALPRIIPATLIMPAVGTLLCWWNLVISNNTRPWRPNKKLKHAGLIWGNTVHLCCLHSLYPQGTEMLRKSRILSDFFRTSYKSYFSVQNSIYYIKEFFGCISV